MADNKVAPVLELDEARTSTTATPASSVSAVLAVGENVSKLAPVSLKVTIAPLTAAPLTSLRTAFTWAISAVEMDVVDVPPPPMTSSASVLVAAAGDVSVPVGVVTLPPELLPTEASGTSGLPPPPPQATRVAAMSIPTMNFVHFIRCP
ncbi:MAG: hypothetical protein EON54_19110 [Alcaligenaceae bacterium]|nr:MAG: hypothetical protein EON54_19110 [Alcaligenaceae bacterium]